MIVDRWFWKTNKSTYGLKFLGRLSLLIRWFLLETFNLKKKKPKEGPGRGATYIILSPNKAYVNGMNMMKGWNEPKHKRQISHQALLVEFWWNSRHSTPSYDELALVIPFAWLRWRITIEIAFVMTGENKYEFYMEIWWISRDGTAGIPQMTEN